LPIASFLDAAVSAPFRMQPGLRRLPPGAPQLSPAAPGSRHQREKLAVLSAYANEALCCVPGFDAQAALKALAEHAQAEHPQHLQWQAGWLSVPSLGLRVNAEGELAPATGSSFGLGDEGPRCLKALPAAWRMGAALALAFEEDFAILDAASGAVPWMAVALPSFWAPREKVGLHFAAVHAPVADNSLLLRASEGLVHLVTEPSVRWERYVWTLTGHTRLHAHPAHVPAQHGWPSDLQAAQVGAHARWRSERQTFIPVPDRAQSVFTIRVEVHPLVDVLGSREQAQSLHASLASMSEAVLQYRGLQATQPALLAWLDQRAKMLGSSSPG
jgi:dimethylamine monooxygenase subunit A